ncbi:MAG: hypothetical protein J6X33_10305 [Clostridiales bacterium]|nr:hypothetical protein [Clostridiales bacterium]
MNRLKKALIAVLASAAIMAACIMPAMADNTYPQSSWAKGGTFDFKKYLVIDENENLPDATFYYDIVPGTAVSSSADKMEVYAGVAGATVGNAVISNGDTTYDAKAAEDVSVTLASGQKYAKTTVTIDFSGCDFKEPGVFRYNLTERNDPNGIFSCDTTTKYVDVYVTDNGQGVLAVSGYTIHSTEEAPATGATAGTEGTDLADKIDGIQNEYETTDLYVGKVVTGNQASRDKYFKFTVKISDLVGQTKLNVGIANADATSGDNLATSSANKNQPNPTELTVSGGEATGTFYLQNNQYVIIYGLMNGAKYEITEDAEDYNSIASSNTAFTIGSANFDDAVKNDSGIDVADGPFYAGFTNQRQGVIPTGIIMKVAPVAIIGVVALAGIIVLVTLNVKRKAEDTEADN